MAIRCFILDDEPLATDLLRDYVGRLPKLDLVGLFNSPTQALSQLQQTPVHVLFLDIQMPGLSGFDFLRPLPQQPKVIFTTAFGEHALESYEFDVLDFIVKPISFERFLRSVGKIYRFIPATTGLTEANETEESQKAYQYFKVNKEMVNVYLEDILWIESLRDYIRIYTVSTTLESYMRISYMEAKLPADQFMRVHKSFIISLHHIQAISATCVRINTVEISIGRLYKAQLDRQLRNEQPLIQIFAAFLG